MKFALLGSEPDVLSLLAAIQASPGHNLVTAYEAHLADDDDHTASELQRGLGTATTDEEWESLLVGSIADAVIVCRGADADRRAEQLRKLAQAGIPLIILHPIGEAVLAFELLMIQQDAGGLIVPYQPAVDHAIWKGLLAAKQSSDHIQQLSIERRLVDQSGESVKQQFARDAMVIRQLMGRIDHLSALAATQNRDEYAGLSVQMSDQHSAVARWALLPASDESTADVSKWKVHHADGTSSTAIFPGDIDQWTLNSDTSVQSTSDQAATAFLQRFTEDRQRHANAQPISRPDWEDACRSIELVENIDISRRRNKTISLYYEDISEENTFKSLMAAGGCLILILLTLLLPTLAAIESIVRSAQDTQGAATSQNATESGASIQPPSSASPFLTENQRPPRGVGWLGKWPLLLLVVLTIFICLQFLRFVTRPAVTDSKSQPPSESMR